MPGAVRRGFPLRVSGWRIRASVLHRHRPVFPPQILRHVPRPQTEVSPLHLFNVSRLLLVSDLFLYFVIQMSSTLLPSSFLRSAPRLSGRSITSTPQSFPPLYFNQFISSLSQRSMSLFMAPPQPLSFHPFIYWPQ